MRHWFDQIALLVGVVYLVFRIGKTLRALAGVRQSCEDSLRKTPEGEIWEKHDEVSRYRFGSPPKCHKGTPYSAPRANH